MQRLMSLVRLLGLCVSATPSRKNWEVGEAPKDKTKSREVDQNVTQGTPQDLQRIQVRRAGVLLTLCRRSSEAGRCEGTFICVLSENGGGRSP